MAALFHTSVGGQPIMAAAEKNPACRFDAGSIDCLRAAWHPIQILLYGNPCDSCPFWAQFCQDNGGDE